MIPSVFSILQLLFDRTLIAHTTRSKQVFFKSWGERERRSEMSSWLEQYGFLIDRPSGKLVSCEHNFLCDFCKIILCLGVLNKSLSIYTETEKMGSIYVLCKNFHTKAFNTHHITKNNITNLGEGIITL